MSKTYLTMLLIIIIGTTSQTSCARKFRSGAVNLGKNVPLGKDSLMLSKGASKVGYAVYEFKTQDKDKRPVTTSLAVWYPTQAQEDDFAYYYGKQKTGTRVAKDAPVAPGTFPLLIYSHGAAAGGLSSAYITETLARRGYIVATVDHTDDAYFSRIRDDGKKGAGLSGIGYATKVYSYYLDNPKAKDRREDIMFRPIQINDAIRFLEEQNQTKDARLNGHLEMKSIGLIGHSFGAWTVLMAAGADPRFSDDRIQAVVSLSSACNEHIFQPGELARITAPVMFMFGEVETKLGRKGDLEYFFNRSNPPKYLLQIEGADHISFGKDNKNRLKTINDHMAKDPARAAIARYVAAFMDLYVKSDSSAKEQLKQSGAGISAYTYEAPELPALAPSTSAPGPAAQPAAAPEKPARRRLFQRRAE